MRKIPHKTLILEHLKRYGSITQKETAERYNCYRLAARIKDLRDEGWPIITEQKDRDGNPVPYAIYRMKKEDWEEKV